MQALGASPDEVREREKNVHGEYAVYNHREDELQLAHVVYVVLKRKTLGQHEGFQYAHEHQDRTPLVAVRPFEILEHFERLKFPATFVSVFGVAHQVESDAFHLDVGSARRIVCFFLDNTV